MRATASRQRKLKAPVPIIDDDCDPIEGTDCREREIATAAYYRAVARGFAPGMEMDDWLQAEAEYDARRRDPE